MFAVLSFLVCFKCDVDAYRQVFTLVYRPLGLVTGAGYMRRLGLMLPRSVVHWVWAVNLTKSDAPMKENQGYRGVFFFSN